MVVCFLACAGGSKGLRYGPIPSMVFLELDSLREAYDSIDWSVIELLGVMLPLGEALEGTGVAGLFTQASS